MGCAKMGLFVPVWSDRILGEWQRAANRNGDGPKAMIEIALLRSDWHDSIIDLRALRNDLWLPDKNDIHVLQTAIDGEADEILTANTSDFPNKILAQHSVFRRHPDEFLLELSHADARVVGVVLNVHTRAEAINGAPVNLRKMLRKTGLPRLGKHMESKSLF